MVALPKGKMTVDEFLAWSDTVEGRFELLHGVTYEMSAERTLHAKVKFRAQKALEAGIRRAGLAYHMLPDGVTVRIDAENAFEPDALVYCGKELPDDAIEVPAPIVIVEVSSPSTKRIDVGVKLAGYFSLPSVQHYLIIDPAKPPVILHSRRPDGSILTSLLASGAAHLDPPGLTVNVEQLFEQV